LSARNSAKDEVTVGPEKDAVVEEFLRYLDVERNASPRTITAYAQALTAFRGQAKGRAWKDCVADDFRDYLFSAMKKRQARSYIRLQFSAFRTFYRFLVERKVSRAIRCGNSSYQKPRRSCPWC
jgi:site-specific recombinase XerD